ncbi:tetratricopeptide repeat protein [Sphingomonas sp.]|uniref:tetratricopeptide repeat protein n=1 Tax=Sphingomonas sp. TaxID=28214 RepID=UPI002DD655C4|nr:tetratricopeptide repeat protein [Sphingomonas sp.]
MRMTIRAALAAATVLTSFGVPAAAQTAVEGRVDRLEREMRAVQRKVFPGGAGMTVEPQITAPQTSQGLPGVPSSSALTDLTARVSALEESVRSVTGQVEQTGYRVRQLEESFNAYKRATDARLKALEDGTAGAAPPAIAAAGDTAPATRPTTRPTTPAPTPTPAATRPAADAARTQALAAVQRPKTSDPAEDGYTYGFRLWEAKLYPEAQAALKETADKYPKHRRASYAQNLLGRAYLDEGKPSLASLAFYDSYKKFPDGERAPDSLFYLADALVKLKKPAADVCKVYSELTDVYGTRLSATMKAGVEKGRVAQKCR